MLRLIIQLLSGLLKKKVESKVEMGPKKKDKVVKPKKPKIWKPVLKNESNRLRVELLTTRRVNRELYDLIHDLAQWVGVNFDKELVITMLFRTQEEQDNIYKKAKRGKRQYSKNPWTSPHQYFHSVDIRSRIFTNEEIKQIENYLNNKYNSTNYYKWTAKNHKVTGGVEHFHLQYVKK